MGKLDNPEPESSIPEEIKGDRLLREGIYEKAAELFLQAADNNQDQKGRLCHRAAVAFWKAGVFDQAASAFKIAISYFRQVENKAYEAKNILGLGASYHGLNRMSEAYRIMHEALIAAEESKDLKVLADVTNWLGIICKDQGDFSLALDHHMKALEISRRMENAKEEASSLHSIGLTYYHMGKYSEAMEYFTQTLEIQINLEDSWGLPDTLNSMGMTLKKMGRLDEALECYLKALEARKNTGELARTASIMNNIGNLYMSNGDIDNAVKYHKEALSIREEISSRSGMASSLLNLGETWKIAGNLHKSSTCLEKSLSYQQSNRADEMKMDTIRMLAEVRNELGDSAKAYELSIQALEMSRNLYSDQVEKRSLESREILETEHKIREAKLLRSKSRKLEILSDMLSSQKEQLQLILDYVPALIVFINDEGTIIRLNRYAARLVEKDPRDLVGGVAVEYFGSLGIFPVNLSEIDNRDISEPLLNSEETITLKNDEHVFLCHRVPFKGSESTLDGVVVFAIDITDEKQAELRKKEIQELTDKAKRFESLGYLAGSIAHDFNNLLLGVMGNVELVIGRTGDAKSRDYLEKASESARSAASLCNQLLAFSGGGNFISEQLDLSDEVRFILKSLSFDPEMYFGFNTSLAEELPRIDISPSQLRLALKNLLSVMEERLEKGDKVDIVTGKVNADADYLKSAVRCIGLSEGDYLFLEVISTAGKFFHDDLGRMFEPFSSGDVFKTDLRIPAVHGILKSHGGFMVYRKTEGSGVAIRLHFPCTKESSPEMQKSESDSIRKSKGSYILVVDDELSVRETAGEMLKSMDYNVITCSGGVSALKLLDEREEDIACVLLDLTMPDMNGQEVLREIVKLHPGVNVILSSGFSEKMISESADNPCFRGFLKKPYTMSELRNMMGEIVNPETKAH